MCHVFMVHIGSNDMMIKQDFVLFCRVYDDSVALNHRKCA